MAVLGSSHALDLNIYHFSLYDYNCTKFIIHLHLLNIGSEHYRIHLKLLISLIYHLINPAQRLQKLVLISFTQSINKKVPKL